MAPTSRGVLDTGGVDPVAWDALALAADNVFATHAWAQAWWRVYGDGATPMVLCDDPRDPSVILPFYRRGRLLREVRWIGHGPADQLGAVCAPAARPMAAALVREERETGATGADVLVLQDMAGRETWVEALGARLVSREASPTLSYGSATTWAEFLAGKSKNFRAQAVRKPARLDATHAVVRRLATPQTLGDDLKDFFGLHAARWDDASPLLADQQRRFTSDFAAVALARGWLRLWMLEVDGRPAAALLGFRFGTVEYYYQLGRDPALDSASVGFAVLVHAVQQGLETGASEFRLLRGDEGYKQRFATEDLGVQTWVLPVSARGRLAAGVARARRRDQR